MRQSISAGDRRLFPQIASGPQRSAALKLLTSGETLARIGDTIIQRLVGVHIDAKGICRMSLLRAK